MSSDYKQLEVLPNVYSMCKIEDVSFVPNKESFLFLAITDEEISLVCKTKDVPQHTLTREDDWRLFRVVGTINFSVIGILSHISGILAEESISIVALSTFNTDYIMIKSDMFDKALGFLKENGYKLC